VENAGVPNAVFIAKNSPEGVIAAVSERGAAPPGTTSPTEYLARRFAGQLGVHDLPIVRATQVHGDRVVVVEDPPAPGETVDAGRCDALVTRLADVALVVQTADCVPVLLSAPGAVAVAHAGWRGSAANVAGAAAQALLARTSERFAARAWLGPSIGPCCYEVGEEVAARFPERFTQTLNDGKFLLDLPAVVRAQLEAAGIPAGSISAHSGCTMCGGDRFASWRRDRENAGRMIALIARLAGR